MKTTFALMAVMLCAAVGNAFDNLVKQSTPMAFVRVRTWDYNDTSGGGKLMTGRHHPRTERIEWLDKYDCISSSAQMMVSWWSIFTTEHCEEWLQEGLAEDGTLRYRKRKKR